jgi:hypothetical protein
MNSFEEIRIVDNFYQTSSFFPMPTVLVGTIDQEIGLTNIGSYSLCFPYYIAGKDSYTMLLECRNSSNTAINILRNGKCSLNFITDSKKYLKECVRLGFPGETTKEKMADCIFTLIDGQMQKEAPDIKHPKIVGEAFQVFECTWLKEMDNAQNDVPLEEYSPPYHNFNGITSQNGAHFILRIDKILLKLKYKKSIIDGVQAKRFPSVPVDYGYRDNTRFWFMNFKKPFSVKIPERKGMELSTVIYAASRIDPDIKFTDEACKMLIKVPRVFLNLILKNCVSWAKENDYSLITEKEMQIINDKRSKEKNR